MWLKKEDIMNWTPLLDWLKQHQDVIALATLVSLILAVGSLLLAVWQILAARKQTESLERIQESVSTRYIGKINDYFPLVINEVQKAEKSITILCDFPAYGYFSAHNKFNKYRLAIRDKIDSKSIDVSLMCLDKAGRADSNLKVLSITSDNWEDWKRNQKHRNSLQELGYNSEDINKLPLKEFLNKLESIDQEMLRVYFEGADIEEFNATLPFDFWLIDGERAIFAFSTYSGDASQYGFFTLDEKLISAFGEIRDRYHLKKSKL